VTVRWLALPAGLVSSALLLVFGGFVVVTADCVGDLETSTSGLCTRFGQLVMPLELCLLAFGTLAPLVGAVATVAERRARWLGYGVFAAAAVLILLMGLAGEQASLLAG